ncbi:ATP-binding cassette domain-containing protein [Streptococcus marmotae]|uniref:ATP-binding cassette domain-containing protein n=1 Tax=Streptococcus marmotae TaxID=1825069 RepID=UPI00082A4457|nr:ABC transporter ATP-binding protein [Streptococcus marmotae]
MKLFHYRSVRLAILSIILLSFLEVAMSYSLSLLVVESVDQLVKNACIVMGIYLLYALFFFLSMKAKALATYFVTQDMKQKTDKWLIHLTAKEYHLKDHGERLSLYVNDVNKVLDLTVGKYLSMVEKAAVTVFVFISLWLIHYSMALIAVISFVVMAFVPSLFQGALSTHILGVQEAKEGYLAKMRELLQGFDTYLENTAFSVFLEKSRKAAYRYAEVVLKADSFTALMSASLTFINSFVTIVALGILSYNVLQGKVAVGAFLSVTALLPSFGSAVMECLSDKEFFMSGQTLYEAKFGRMNQPAFEEKRFCHSISAFKEVPLPQKETEEPALQTIQAIQLENIRLDYDGKVVTFPEELQFRQGQKYAIMGESGCGKSSLLKVLIGQNTDYTGTVLVNGKVAKQPLFSSLSYVNQTTFLFNDTIRHNIDLLGQHESNELLAVLQLLNLEHLSLDDRIEDNGKNLSGGQRQRLAIARALLRSKDCIVLDEATANLDRETAEKIEEYILGNVGLVIMVSHHMTEHIREKIDKVIRLA